MTQLAPNLFDRRFDDLVQEGLSLLPSLAPVWTDYNAHDPGITLMELLAWVAEAQMYSLARMRRDERLAYAALLGIVPSGPTPALGLIWPDRNDTNAPAVQYQESLVIDTSEVARVAIGQMPTFHPTHKILWVPGQVRRLRTRLANGQHIDLTAKNARGDRVFEPFGPRAGPHDELLLNFSVNGVVGLFPSQRSDANGACLAVGVRADAPAVEPPTTNSPVSLPAPSGSMTVTLVSDGRRSSLPVVADGTDGFLHTGVVLLDVSSVVGSPTAFTLE
jgi:predicted phage baseplate assembly protein